MSTESKSFIVHPVTSYMILHVHSHMSHVNVWRCFSNYQSWSYQEAWIRFHVTRL